MSVEPDTYLLTWGLPDGIGLLAKGLEWNDGPKLNPNTRQGRFGRVVGPSVVLRAFAKAFGDTRSPDVRLTVKHAKTGRVELDNARVILESYGSEDFPVVEAADMTIAGAVQFTVWDA